MSRFDQISNRVTFSGMNTMAGEEKLIIHRSLLNVSKINLSGQWTLHISIF